MRALLLLLFWVAAAQADVTVSGRVVTDNGTPVAGASVRFRAAAAAASIAAQTDADAAGGFSLALPQAGSYLVDADRRGFFPLKAQPLELGDGPNEIRLVMNPLRDVLESIEVAEPPAVIDLDRSVSERSVTNNDMMAVPIPNTNNIRNALRIVPGMVTDNRGGLHLSGGTEEQTLYLVDGFQVNDPVNNRWNTRLGVEAVQSVQIHTGVYAPEFGRGSAGVLAIQTKSGDDKLRYSATNFVPGVESRKGLILSSWTPRANLSGPLRRGRAWFSNNLEAQYDRLVVEELPRGEDSTSSWRWNNHLNTQVNLTPSNILYSGFLATWWTAPRNGLGALDPPETTVDRRARQWFWRVKDQIFFPRSSFLEIGYASNRTYWREIPQGDGLYQFTPFGRRGFYFSDLSRNASRDQVIANFVASPAAAFGTHQWKAGIDISRVGYGQRAFRTGYEQQRWDSSLSRRVYFRGSGMLATSNVETAAFIQDSWRPRPNLLVETGIRMDRDNLVRNWTLSPRLGVSWKPGWLELTKISGGAGIVHDPTILPVFSRPNDQYSVATYFDSMGRAYRAGAAQVFLRTANRFRQPQSRNWNLGVEQLLPYNLEFRLGYLERRGRRGFTYINTLDPAAEIPAFLIERYHTSVFDAAFDLRNFRRDRYRSLEIAIRQNLRNQYGWMVSYTRSRSLSNAAVDISVEEPVLIGDNFGPMAWDTPNRLLSWGYLPTFWKTWAVAYLLETRDGFPFSVQDEDGRLQGAVNRWRFPRFFEVNLHLEKTFSFRQHRWALRFGANNLTGHRNPNAVNSQFGSPDFLRFYGGLGRAINVRLRWLGRR